jgi:hypothetical protein
VTDSSHTPIANATVYVFGADGTELTTTTTGSDGTYGINDLPEGDAYVCAAPSSQNPGPNGGYLDECDGSSWDGFSSPVGNDPPITLTTATVTKVDFSVGTAGAVTGTITDSTGQPADGIVLAIDSSGALAGIALTDGTSGSYLVSIPNPGTYNICVMPNAATLAWECYRDADWDGFGSPAPPDATGVSVSDNETVPGIDIAVHQSADAAGNAQATDRLARRSPVVAYQLRQWQRQKSQATERPFR